MSINRYKSHLVILPEDRANEEIINGFIQAPNIEHGVIRIERPAGGWTKARDKFLKQLVPDMRRYTECFTVILIDFDLHTDRFDEIHGDIPQDLKESVFILGILSEPEELKKKVRKNYEEIGEVLAQGCPESKNELWQNDLLKHNDSELNRIILAVKPFLFK